MIGVCLSVHVSPTQQQQTECVLTMYKAEMCKECSLHQDHSNSICQMMHITKHSYYFLIMMFILLHLGLQIKHINWSIVQNEESCGK